LRASKALRGPQKSVDAMRAEFQKRRDVMVAGLNKIKGFSCRLPKGAFYVFPNITKTRWPSKKLADALLDDAGVAGLSGTAFGNFGEGYLRFSVANSIEKHRKSARSRKPIGPTRTCRATASVAAGKRCACPAIKDFPPSCFPWRLLLHERRRLWFGLLLFRLCGGFPTGK